MGQSSFLVEPEYIFVGVVMTSPFEYTHFKVVVLPKAWAAIEVTLAGIVRSVRPVVKNIRYPIV